MAYNKHENAYEINEQQLAAFLADALNRVESDNDPDTLNKLKKIFVMKVQFMILLIDSHQGLILVA